MANDLDLICMGRSCVDLYSDEFGAPLERAMSFVKSVGGSPMNIAIGTARLGLKVGAVTAVGREDNGRYLRWQLECEGVDTAGVKTDPARLTAMVLLSIRGDNDFPLIQYRENCADMGLTADDVDRDYLARAKALLVTGTHLSKPGVKGALFAAVRAAKELGLKCILDIDYRPNLWGLQGHDAGSSRWAELSGPVTAAFQEALPFFDLIVGTAEEYHIAGGSTDDIESLRNVRAKSDALLVFKLGDKGCAAIPGPVPDSFDSVTYPGFPVNVYNSIGAGDGFMSGFLRGWLRGEDLATCCRFANAAGAFAVSRLGCSSAYPSWVELEYFLQHGSEEKWLRNDAVLEQLHWSTNRRRQWRGLTVLAFDHREYFEKTAAVYGKGEADIIRSKELIFRGLVRAAEEAGDENAAFGVIADDAYGLGVLLETNKHPFWVGRNITTASKGPLRFEGGPDVGMTLKQWPENHVAKCLMHCGAGDAFNDMRANETQLKRLAHACRGTGHELLLELVCPPDETGDAPLLYWIKRCYEIGVFPDYWKLLPRERETWRRIDEIITANDPYCRGVMLLGQDLREEELTGLFRETSGMPRRLGFAIGRSIFGKPLVDFFSGALDEDAFTAGIQTNFLHFVRAWRETDGEAHS